MKPFLIFTLILSIGIISVIPSVFAYESDQICIDKVWIEHSKGKIACVALSATDKLVLHEDGSYGVYVGTESSEGMESNWIKTNEGDGLFVIFHFYSLTDVYYDKNWQLPMIEKIG